MFDLPERFWSKVDKSGDCWVWTAAKYRNGYGNFSFERHNRPVHRLAYEAFKGPIPEGLTIDHLCRNHACCNPDHLEAVSKRENTLRGVGPTAVHARKTRCKYGHPLEGDNVAIYANSRVCRTCALERGRKTYARRGHVYNQHKREKYEPKPSNSRKGIPHGPMREETKQKLREAAQGRTMSDEARAKLSAAHKGRPWSEKRRAASQQPAWQPSA